jgi:hypothetical protein
MLSNRVVGVDLYLNRKHASWRSGIGGERTASNGPVEGQLIPGLAGPQNSLTWGTDFLQFLFPRRWSTQIFNDIFVRSHLGLADERSTFLDHEARCF